MKVIILAGGSGTRLWPLSRAHFPKQFLKFDEPFSFFQKTVKRHLIGAASHDIYVVTSSLYEFEVKKQLAEIDNTLIANVVLEPSSKNTAPAIIYALQVMQISSEETVLISPADQLMVPDELFWKYVEKAKFWASQNYLVTFTVFPTKPETGFGYIYAEDFHVKAFVEKPSREMAQKFLNSGKYYWNAGLFAFKVGHFLKELEEHAPELVGISFEQMPSISLDYALLEKSKRAVAIPLEGMIWSDVGSWDTIYETRPKDEEGNAILGNAFAFGTKNSLIFADQKLVVTLGIENLCVIDTNDALLVADKSQGQQLKSVVDHLKKLGKKEVESHACVHRPWGFYTVLLQGKRYKIKKIQINPQQKLSLQLHYHRSEHWVVVSGTALVTINGQQSHVHEGESIYVPKSAIHRVENPGKVPLEIIEVQEGEYLEEDDIVRLEDVYGRIKEKEAFQILHAN